MLPSEEGLSTLIQAFADGIMPDPELTVSEWADRFRYLSPKASAEPGLWKTSRTPYLRGILDALSPESPVERITFTKSAQVGATEAANNFIGYIIDACPGPTLLVMPILELCKRNSRQRIDPLIEACPSLKRKIAPKKSRDASNTTFQKDFLGGTLVMTGANSSTGLSSMPCRYVMLDEVDRYPDDVDGEGDPVELAIKRTETFSRKKIFELSTPTHEGRSKIQKSFEVTDQRRYFVPCPECGHFQHLKWIQLKWENKDPTTVYYQCEQCPAKWKESDKAWFLPRGEWRSTSTGLDPKHIGFHINGLYSPLGWGSWEKLVRQWLAIRGDVNKLKSFINTVLGETFKDKSEAPNWKRLYDRREQYTIGTLPNGAKVLTAGADVQRHGIFVEVKAWGLDSENWSIDWLYFEGDTSTETPWKKLDALLSRRFSLDGGGNVLIKNLAIDTGYNTKMVYQWCRRYPISRVLPIKGVSGQTVPLSTPKSVDVGAAGKTLKRGLRVIRVAVDMLKTELYGWLNLESPTDEVKASEGFPPGFCHFPQYDQEFFEQLTAERIVEKSFRGFKSFVWEKTRERNEALDCSVYNRAASIFLAIDRMTENDFMELDDTNMNGESQSQATSSQEKEAPGTFRKPSDPPGIIRRKSTWI